MPVLNQLLANSIKFGRSVLHTYATVLFSDKPWIGAIIMAATFAVPIVGLAGLFGIVTALLFGRLFGFESWESGISFLAFNSLLTCLGIAHYFPSTFFFVWVLLGVLTMGSVFSLLFFLVLNSIVNQQTKMPSMSLSFSLVSILIWLFYMKISEMNLLPFAHRLWFTYEPHLPKYVMQYFHSVGSIFYQPHFLAGLLIAIALFCISRIGLLLTVIGYTVGYIFIKHWGGMGGNDILYPGFNLILTSFAVGGIFLIPSRISYLLAIIAAFLGLVFSFALQIVFVKYHVPPFALPFNLTVITMIYALKLRLKNRHPMVNDLGILHPENVLEYVLTRIDRFAHVGRPLFYLPFHGDWTITQGNHGPVTHKADWAYAWDFEMRDNSGKFFHNNPQQTDDYYCYGKPVLASADGYVAHVLDGIEDNPVGQINTEQKWGNYITIHHGEGVYSLYAHLKPGSIKIKAGDFVRHGEKIGLVGNSGRSAVPHLHFHIQNGMYAGAKTLFADIAHYKKKEAAGQHRFISHGTPGQEEIVSPLVPVDNLQQLLHLLLYQEMSFRVQRGKKEVRENWKVDVSFYGAFYIQSDGGSYLEFSVFNGIYNALSFRGKRNTALYAFAVLLSRCPFVENTELLWQDTPSYSVLLRPVTKQFILFITPLWKPFRFVTQSSGLAQNKNLKVKSDTAMLFLGQKLLHFSGELQLEQKMGLLSIQLNRHKKACLRAERILEETSSQS